MIQEFVTFFYPWTKVLHIVSVIAWMAGLFYLPRLFVYHTESAVRGDSRDEIFQVMEAKLFAVIMRPAMIASWCFGLMLVLTPGIVDWSSVWPYTKGASILLMTGFHEWLGRRVRDFAAGENTLTGRRYRLMNEVPTVLMIIIVASVVVRF